VVFDFGITLEAALAEATGVTLKDLRKNADAFEASAGQFWRVLTTLKFLADGEPPSGSTDMPVSAPAASPRGPVYRAVRRSTISRRRTISFRPRRDTPCGRRWSMHSCSPAPPANQKIQSPSPSRTPSISSPAGLSGDGRDHHRGPLGSCACSTRSCWTRGKRSRASGSTRLVPPRPAARLRSCQGGKHHFPFVARGACVACSGMRAFTLAIPQTRW
jgi:hypothetical protein